jgi:hypothetical protein
MVVKLICITLALVCLAQLGQSEQFCSSLGIGDYNTNDNPMRFEFGVNDGNGTVRTPVYFRNPSDYTYTYIGRLLLGPLQRVVEW